MSASGNVFTHLSPGRMIFGPGSVNQLPQAVNADQRHLLVTDPGLTKAGLTARIQALLEEAGVAVSVYDRVPADPPVEAVEEALALALETGCEAVIGLGGGSSLDAAKGVAARMAHPEVSLVQMGDGWAVEGPLPPLYAIPTTAGTGSEATRVAVITDPKAGVKMAVRGECLAPTTGFLDPELLASLPPRLMAETGADALTHAVEAYVSRNANPVTDALALAAVEMIGQNLRQAVADPTNSEAVGRMLMASCLAGQAFSNAGLGLVHSMAEPLGAAFHVSHGLGCALLLPVIMDFNRLAAPERFINLALALGEDPDDQSEYLASAAAVRAVRGLLTEVGVPLNYLDAGISFYPGKKLVDDVLPQFSTQCNPRRASREQIADLYCVPYLDGNEPEFSPREAFRDMVEHQWWLGD